MDRDSAEVLADHILLDMEMCDGCEIEDTWWMESFSCGLKMLMLIASYPTILNESTYLQDCVALEKTMRKCFPGSETGITSIITLTFPPAQIFRMVCGMRH